MAAFGPVARRGEASKGEGLDSLRVLLVDDEEVVLLILSRLLTQDGHQVDTAQGGHEALRMLEHESYDLLITDHGMPIMDGLELARRARSLRPLPILMLTGSSEITRVPEEVDEIMPKPVTKEDLREALWALCGVAGPD